MRHFASSTDTVMPSEVIETDARCGEGEGVSTLNRVGDKGTGITRYVGEVDTSEKGSEVLEVRDRG